LVRDAPSQAGHLHELADYRELLGVQQLHGGVEMIAVQVKNHSTVVADNDVKRVVDACNKQVLRHFGPVYGTQAEAHFAAKDTPLSQYDWQLIVVDDADTAGALGYHETSKNGTPLGYCFAKTTQQDGGLWTVTFSHEFLELLGDPEINLGAIDETGMKLYALEVCDACEDDSLAYAIDGVSLSDFVLPNFWLSSTPVHAACSYTGAVKKPLQILPGGYLAYMDLHNVAKGWQQHTARADGGVGHGSRLPRRGIPKALRRASVTA
jgi:hypothetical protein